MHSKRVSALDEREITAHLQRSAALVGKLYPVLVGKHGEIIDGRYRLKADPNWPRVEVQSVDSEEQRLLARLISNACRRDISSEEKTEMLRKLGRLNLEKGVQPSKLIKIISEKTGMSYRWVMKYAPDELKVRPGLGGPKKLENLYESEEKFYFHEVASPAIDDGLFLEPRERVASLVGYSNTNFATIILEKQFYLKLSKAATELKVDPCIIINNALIMAFQKAEKLAKRNHVSIMIHNST